MYDWIEKNRWFYLVFAAIVFGSCLGVFYWQGVLNAERHGTIDVAGMYGDSFGYSNALFSSLALAGVVLALFVQTLEFGLAAKERKEGIVVQQAISQQQFFSTLATSVDSLRVAEDSIQKNAVLELKSLESLVFSIEQRDVLRSVVSVMIGGNTPTMSAATENAELLLSRKKTHFVRQTILYHKRIMNEARGLEFAKDRTQDSNGLKPSDYVTKLIQLHSEQFGINGKAYLGLDYCLSIETLRGLYGEFVQHFVDALNDSETAKITRTLIDRGDVHLGRLLSETFSLWLRGEENVLTQDDFKDFRGLFDDGNNQSAL